MKGAWASSQRTRGPITAQSVLVFLFHGSAGQGVKGHNQVSELKKIYINKN